MDKILHVAEWHNDYRVKDPKSFAKEHCKHIKKMRVADVQIEDEPMRPRKVKVKQLTNVIFEWDETKEKWAFSCDAVLNILD